MKKGKKGGGEKMKINCEICGEEIDKYHDESIKNHFCPKPQTELKTRDGHRIITKIKHKDFI